jgi:hypothetical protein
MYMFWRDCKCILFIKSVDDFTNMVLFNLSRTFFDDIYKFVNGFRNIKNINKNNYKYEEYFSAIYKYYEYDYKNITN